MPGQEIPAARSADLLTNVRIATFNCSLNRRGAGELIRDLRRGDAQASQVAAILQSVRPDIVLINEFDWDEAGEAIRLFRESYLERSQFGLPPIEYRDVFTAPVNTGEPTGLDLDGDGSADTPQDAYGFGQFPGQYGMLILSRFPLDVARVRTFQRFLWQDLPGAELPRRPETGDNYYAAEVIRALRLSSKSHWDVPVKVTRADGSAVQTIHLLASHPTPPVFDGPEDRNGCRNQDEIRFWNHYLQRTDDLGGDAVASRLRDDQGNVGGLPTSQWFVLLGDLNSDPHDGDSRHQAIRELLAHPRVNSMPAPTSSGGVQQSQEQAGANLQHQGSPAEDTADFGDGARGSGNLRVDYVLPSRQFRVLRAAVFWPTSDQPEFAWIGCSDHRLVWVDLQLGDAAP